MSVQGFGGRRKELTAREFVDNLIDEGCGPEEIIVALIKTLDGFVITEPRPAVLRALLPITVRWRKS